MMFKEKKVFSLDKDIIIKSMRKAAVIAKDFK